MSNVYIRKELYIELIKKGYDPVEFVNKAVEEKLKKQKKEEKE